MDIIENQNLIKDEKIILEEADLTGDLNTQPQQPEQQSASNMQQQTPAPNSNLNFGFLNQIPKTLEMFKPNVWISRKRETLKPWSEFMNFSKFKKPNNVGQFSSRVIRNIAHFQSNYLFLFIFFALYCVLTSPLLLFTFMIFTVACYVINTKNKDGLVNVMGRDFAVSQLHIGMMIISIPVFLMAGVGSAIFWIIGATVVVGLMHAAFYARDEVEDPFLAAINNTV